MLLCVRGRGERTAATLQQRAALGCGPLVTTLIPSPQPLPPSVRVKQMPGHWHATAPTGPQKYPAAKSPSCCRRRTKAGPPRNAGVGQDPTKARLAPGAAPPHCPPARCPAVLPPDRPPQSLPRRKPVPPPIVTDLRALRGLCPPPPAPASSRRPRSDHRSEDSRPRGSRWQGEAGAVSCCRRRRVKVAGKPGRSVKPTSN